MSRKIILLIGLFVFGLLGCSDLGSGRTDQPDTAVPVQPTLAPLNTLVPTFTPLADISQVATATPNQEQLQAAVDPTATIDFEQKTVQIIYQIPALQLSRRLEGNVSGQITVIDQTNPFGIQRPNQGSILLDLQRRLPEIELSALPTGCDACVFLQYTLPLTGESREGWLQDPVILASVENYMAALVGPHFPPETVVGLRREASSYYPAHSVAVTADSRVHTWLATEPQVSEPYTSTPSIVSSLADLPLAQLENMYATNCPPEPVETLRIYTTEEPLDIAIRCPAYALPTTLLPLYAQLDQLLAEKLAVYDGPERPPTGLPLEAVLDYQRLDGNQLTLSQNGRVTIQNSSQIIYTGTMSVTGVISLTTDLLNSGQLQPGLTTLTESAPVPTPQATTETPVVATPAPSGSSLLLVRGPEGVLDGKFNQIELPLLDDLNALLDSLLAPSEPTATPTAETDGTPVVEPPTETPTPTPSS